MPAYRKLLDFFRDEYLPKARTTRLGAGDCPTATLSIARRSANLRRSTSAPRRSTRSASRKSRGSTPRCARRCVESGFKGSFEEFLKFLRTDPQFYAKTPDELMGVSSYVAKRVDNVLGDYFGLLPRRRHGIIPVPDALAPFYTAGRGGLENCQMNTYNLPTRPLYNIPALTLHECTPGPQLPGGAAPRSARRCRAFRRNIYFSGYGEGWGLYTEWLGNEMGIYRTPYERFGQLSYEMWRAARLVIDTGLHLNGWSRAAGDRLSRQPHGAVASMRSRPRSTATSAGRARRWPTSSAS